MRRALRAAALAQRSRPDEGAAGGQRRNTVIIVDDEAAVRRYVGAVVRKMGLEGIEAVSTEDVRRIAAEHKDAVVVLDIALGRDDAGSVLAALAGQRFSGGIILISGHDRTLLEWTHGIGADMNLNMLSTLHKPFTPETLRRSIRAAGPAFRGHSDDAAHATPAV